VSAVTDDERKDENEQQAAQAEDPQAAEEPAQQPESAAQEAEQAEEPAEAPPVEMDVFDLLRMSVGLFAQEAWIGLGIQARPGSSEVKPDLRLARTAIDTLEFLVGQLGDELEAAEKREMDALLANLRINYVQRSGSEEQ